MEYRCSSTFEKQFLQLIKKPKDNYNSLPKDISEFLASYPKFENLLKCPETLLIEEGKIQLKKTRLRNRGMNLDAKDGFRLIYILDKEKETCTLLYVFPKQGKHSRDELTEGEYTELLSCYVSEKETSCLKTVDIVTSIKINPISPPTEPQT